MPESWLASYPEIREHEPLAPHSWYGIGGRARYFLELTNESSVAPLIERLNVEQVPYLVIGAATNTLFAGDELPGLTLKLSTRRLALNGEVVSVSAGYMMPALAAAMAKAGRAGLEFAAGVPGMVGGSVVGNAGAFGGEIKDQLVHADVVDVSGEQRRVLPDECAFTYRESVFKRSRSGWVIIAASFRTQQEEPATVRARLLDVQKYRRRTQPVEARSLGSTFKNPPGDAAGRLIDAAGLKGRRIGGAQVSEKHANFIINVGGASADDVLALMAEMRNRVRDRFGIDLEPEIRVVGRAPFK